MTIFRKVSILLVLLFSASCVETVVVGSLAGGTLASREKNFSDTRKDVAIATKLGIKYIRHGLKNPGNSVDITVSEGRVMLTGIARDPDRANLASELAWKVRGVKEVIDEIQMAPTNSIRFKDITSASADYAITARVETKLLFTKRVASLNYKVTTVDNVVYLLGIASNDAEIRRVLKTVAKISGVKKVVNHIILANDKRRRT